MTKRGWLAAFALLPLLFLGDERVILNPLDRGLLPNVPVSPEDHSGTGIEYHPPFGGDTGSSLLTGLAAYWKLDEQSGTREDAYGSNDLSAVNAPTAVGGAGMYAALNASTKALTSSDANLGAANTSFTVSVWAQPNNLGSNRYLMSGPVADWYVGYNNLGAAVAGCSDSTAGAVGIAIPDAPAIGRRYMVTLVYDQATKKCQIYHDATAGAASNALTNGIKNSSAAFVIASDAAAGSTSSYRGTVGPAAYWGGKALSSTEVGGLYNAGLGFPCASLPASLQTSLTACWDLDEASGTRAESGVGSCGTPACDLTAVNAPLQTVGLVQSGLGLSAYSIATSTQALNVDDNPALSMGDIEFTVSCWVNPTVLANNIVLDKTDEYRLGIDAASKPYMKAGTTDTATWGSATTAGTWILLSGGHNVAEGTWVSVNDGARVTTAETAAPADTANALRIFSTSAGGSYFTGAVDACAIWKKDVPVATIGLLYAAGVGVEYPWGGIASLFVPPRIQWASMSTTEKQRALYARYGAWVPGFMIPSRSVYAR